jgi:hypothetical protein
MISLSVDLKVTENNLFKKSLELGILLLLASTLISSPQYKGRVNAA